MMITCQECKKEYSSEAKACVHCGARNPHRMSGAGKLGVGVAVVVGLFVVFLIIGTLNSPTSGGSATTADLCSQSAEAAHYIAAMSASPSDVVRVTDQVIADRKYPLLGDKVVASIGNVIAIGWGTRTPDQFADSMRATCERNAGS